MSVKYLAIGSLLALGFASPAMAGVNQTVTGIQQSDQFQYAEGDGDILQNSTNIQNLNQRADVFEGRGLGHSGRGRRGFGGRRESVQQTVTGVQTNIQEQEGLGFGIASDIVQNSNNVNLLDQSTSVRRFSRGR